MLFTKSVFKISILQLAGIVVSLLFHMLQVAYFGASRSIESYFLTLGLIHSILGLVQADQVNMIFLPKFHEILKKQNTHQAFKAFTVLLNRMLLPVMGIVVLMLLLSRWTIVESGWLGFEYNYRLLTYYLFLALAPTIALQFFNFLAEGLLAANHIYGRTEFLVLLSSLSSCFILWLTFEYFGIWSLALSWWIGCLLRAISNVIFLSGIGYRYSFVFSTPFFDHRHFFRTVRSAYGFALCNQIYQFVFLSVISYLPSGIFAVFKYVENIFTRFQRLFTEPVATVFFTDFSKAKQQANSISNTILKRGFKQSLILSALGTLLLITFGKDILQFLWSSGFGQTNLSIGYAFLVAYSITLVVTGFGIIFQKVIFAHDKASAMYLGLGLIRISAAVLAWGLISTLGIRGLIIMIILSELMINGLFLFLVKPLISFLANRTNLIFLTKILFAGLLILVGGYFFNNTIHISWGPEFERLSIIFNVGIKFTLLAIFSIVVSQWLKILPDLVKQKE